LDKEWLKQVNESVEMGKVTSEEAHKAIEEEYLAQATEMEWLAYVLTRLDKEQGRHMRRGSTSCVGPKSKDR
jgi:hypothetical protein